MSNRETCNGSPGPRARRLRTTLVVIAASAAACGGGSTETPTTHPSSASPASSAAATSSAPSSSAGSAPGASGGSADSASSGAATSSSEGNGSAASSAAGGASSAGSSAGNADAGVADAGGGEGDGGSPGGGTFDGGSCGVTPVAPNATDTTRKVLCYLHSIYGNHILSGQEEDNNDNGMNAVVKATGQHPAVRSFDVNNSEAPTQCVAQWNAGGLCMFGYHVGINGGTYNTRTNIGNVLTAGTAENTSFNHDLDRIAQFVQPLQDAGGVAILRLFHEAGQNCNWFWWSMGSSSQWQDLYRYAFHYLTGTKALRNVLFLAPLCGQPSSAYNPGPGYIDFGGADTYVSAGDYEPLTDLFHRTENAFPGLPVMLHECGSIPDPDKLQATATKWLLFNVWANPYFSSPNNTPAHFQAVYSNPYVITRERLPSFK